MSTDACPCGSQKTYQECCGLYHSGQKSAPTPEALMRSRYSAFALKNYAYIEKTIKGPALKEFDRKFLEENPVNWVGLRVLKAEGDFVEFVALYQTREGFAEMHEKSKFIKERNRWYYYTRVE